MAMQLIPGEGALIPAMPRFSSSPSFATTLLIDATGEKVAFIGHVWNKARATKSIRKVGILFGAVTKAGGSALTLSLQDVDTANGPVARPDETQDQTVAIANADAAFATNTWYQTGNLSADRSVAFGEMLAVVIEYDGAGRLGSDSVIVRGITALENRNGPLSVLKVGASWLLQTVHPNVILEFSDGTFGTLRRSWPLSDTSALSFASNTTPDEYAMEFQLPGPCNVDGGWVDILVSASTSDFEIVLYDGTTALATTTIEGNWMSANNIGRHLEFSFSAEVALSANTTYRLAIKPTTTSAVSIRVLDVAAAGHMQAHAFGEYGLTSRTDAGSWAAATTTRRMFAGLSISSISDNVGGGGGLGDRIISAAGGLIMAGHA